jgi:hypothetical protein
VPALAPLESHYYFARFGVSGVVVVVSLFILHMWLPAGRRGFGAVRPGILATMVLWLICGFTFGHYLAEFAIPAHFGEDQKRNQRQRHAQKLAPFDNLKRVRRISWTSYLPDS